MILSPSCKTQKKLSFNDSDVTKIEVQGFQETGIELQNDFKEEFIKDLNESKNLGPTKFAKSHRFLIHHSDGKIDTLLTNGTIHKFNGWYQSKVNLLEKYFKVEVKSLGEIIISALANIKNENQETTPSNL